MVDISLAAGLELGGGDRILVGVVAVVALVALAVGFVLRREVLAAGEGVLDALFFFGGIPGGLRHTRTVPR